MEVPNTTAMGIIKSNEDNVMGKLVVEKLGLPPIIGENESLLLNVISLTDCIETDHRYTMDLLEIKNVCMGIINSNEDNVMGENVVEKLGLPSIIGKNDTSFLMLYRYQIVKILIIDTLGISLKSEMLELVFLLRKRTTNRS
jgi:hypothetical protein